MEFILNLITFLLVAVGMVFAISTSDKNRDWIYFRFDLSKLSTDKFVKIDNFLDIIYILSISAVVLGVGITIARLFS